MSISSANHSFPLVTFAGGLGTRLKGTEALPKPLVPINGYSLLSRILLHYHSTSLFDHHYILTCDSLSLFSSHLSREISHLPYTIVNESNRTGRLGALSHFIAQYPLIQHFFVCNGDTLISHLHSLSHYQPPTNPNFVPDVFLANADDSRHDYTPVYLPDSSSPLQNSGLAFLSSQWLLENIPLFPDLSSTDLDDILFNQHQSPNFFKLDSPLYDAGTPTRLELVRSIFT